MSDVRNLEWLLGALAEYEARHEGERAVVRRFRRLVEEAGERALDRRHLPGHLTASGWVVDPEARRCVLVLHRKLDKWLQPGGHADGEADLLAVAAREVAEETRLQEIRPVLPRHVPIDLDVHSIPAREGEPAHLHFDVRYLFVAPPGAPVRRNAESREVRWVELSGLPRLTRETSLLRLALKGLESVRGGFAGPGRATPSERKREENAKPLESREGESDQEDRTDSARADVPREFEW